MGATVEVNGFHIGTAADQFLRYIFPIPQNELSHGSFLPQAYESDSTDVRHTVTSERAFNKQQSLLQRQHTLSISFDPKIETNGRFMACSGGWDWAPYSRTGDERNSNTFSFGIVKAVHIVTVQYVLIAHVTTKIYYLGGYPR